MSITIKGPISCSYHENGEQSVFIFGDRHIRIQSECKSDMSITKFIENLGVSIGDVNLFVEGHESDLEEKENNYLMEVIKTQKKGVTKYLCDIRKNNKEYIYFYTFLNICSGLINEKNISEATAKYNCDLLKKILSNISFNMGSLIEFFNPNIVYNKYLKNDIESSMYKNKIKALIQQGTVTYLKNIGNEKNIFEYVQDFSEELEEGHENFINTFLEDNKKWIEELYDNVAEYGQVFMDALILSKVLDSKSSVVYVGEAHARVYRKFFNDHNLFTQKFLVESDNQCVSINLL
jgi:hypothetical protein